MTAASLAEVLGCALDGADRVLDGAAPLESAREQDLAFVANAKSFGVAVQSRAGCLIAPPGYPSSEKQSVIYAECPRALFARALPLLYPQLPLVPGVDSSVRVGLRVSIAPTAEIGAFCSIGEGSGIGADTLVGPGCRIGRDVRIGVACRLYAGVVLYDGTRVGDRVTLHAGCVIGADGFGYAPEHGRWVKFPQVGYVEIEGDVEIGANSCVDRAALGRTRIGAGSKLDNLVHVGHNCDVGRNVVIAAQTGLSGGVVVEDGAIIGGQVGIGDKARIGAGVVLGSGSGVLTSKIVRAGEPLWGTPARPLKDYLKQLAALARWPELRADLKALRERLDRLEKDRN